MTTPETPELECGAHANYPATLYHQLPYTSSTFVKGFAANPFKAKFQPFTGNDAATLGSACHSYSLEGAEAFNDEYYILSDFPCPDGQNPKGWKSTNAYKALKSEDENNANGRIVLTPEQWQAVQGVDASLREHPTTSRMLNRGANELTLIWIDESTGLKCKCRIDDYFNGVPSDLKTSADITWFQTDIYRRFYNLQAAWYSIGVIACGLEYEYFCFLAAQTTETYPVRCGYIAPEKLEYSQQECSRLLGLIKECKDRDIWPNYTIPKDVFSLDQITPGKLLEEW